MGAAQALNFKHSTPHRREKREARRKAPRASPQACWWSGMVPEEGPQPRRVAVRGKGGTLRNEVSSGFYQSCKRGLNYDHILREPAPVIMRFNLRTKTSSRANALTVPLGTLATATDPTHKPQEGAPRRASCSATSFRASFVAGA